MVVVSFKLPTLLQFELLQSYMEWLMTVVPILILLIGVGLAISIIGTVYEHRMHRRDMHMRAQQVITIEESPCPTRTQPTCESMRRRASPKSAARAGSRRIRAHKRPFTCAYNPSWDGHCVYACILRAKGMRVTLKAICALRKQVAQVIHESYMTGEQLGDI